MCSDVYMLNKRYIDVFENINHTNYPVLGLSASTIVVLAIFKGFGPKLQRIIKVPFPIELFVVIFGILICNYLNLDTKENVKVVGEIPTGLPYPVLPNMEMIGKLAVESIGLTFVGIASALSMGRIYARKNNYQIDCNQELIALGSSSIFSGFFSCIPSTASISMTSVQEGAGGKTQLVSLISCLGVLMVLLFLAPLLNKLPQCVLSAIIVVSLKGLLSQMSDLKYYWKISKLDALIWIVTFVAVIFLNVDVGLAVGVAFSLVVLLWRSNRPKSALLGEVPSTNVYVPIKKYLAAQEEPGVKIFQFNGPLHFANVDYFRGELARRTGVSPSDIQRKLAEKTTKLNSNTSSRSDLKEAIENSKCNYCGVKNINKNSSSTFCPVSLIILDCTGFSYIDAPSASALKEIFLEHKNVGVDIFIAACSASVYDILKKVKIFEATPSHTFFPTVHDAVLHAHNRNGIPDSQVLDDLPYVISCNDTNPSEEN